MVRLQPGGEPPAYWLGYDLGLRLVSWFVGIRWALWSSYTVGHYSPKDELTLASVVWIA
jgi:hypothetical protein